MLNLCYTIFDFKEGNMAYTQDEINLALHSVAKVKDLNSILPTESLKDILPNYPDEKMMDWPVGFFLLNSRNGHNVKYYDTLYELGFSFYRQSLISKINLICQAIDDLVEAGVDLNNIPIKAKVGDYIDRYKKKGYNFSIGVTLENARKKRECKAVMAKLKEHNFDFSKGIMTKQDIIKKIVTDVASVTDLRTIPAKATVKDFLPNYDPEFVDFNIGILVQNVRAGGYKFLIPTLNELGFSFEKVRQKSQSSTICNIIDDLVKHGVDLNNILSVAVVGDFIPDHPNKSFAIGKFLRNAAFDNVGQDAKKKLEESGFKFMQRTLSTQQKIEILTKVAENVSLNKIKSTAILKDVLPDCDPRFEAWEIGKFLETNRKNRNPKYREILKNLGLRFHKVEKKHDAEFIIKAINDLVDQGVDLNTIKQRDKMSKYITSYSHDDFLIGALLSNARAQKTSEEVANELTMHNFDFTQKPVTVPIETKINILKMLMEKGVDINSMTSRHRLSDFIELKEGERDYRVGLWVTRLEKSKQKNRVLDEMVKLGYQPKEKLVK